MDVDLELEVKISRRELQVRLLHEFRFGHKATEATTRNICGTMGKDVLSTRTAQHWFHRLKNGNFELDDLPHTGRPVQVNVDVLKQLIEEDLRLTNRCLAERLGCSHSTVETHLHEFGKTWKYGVWIPHGLSPHQLQHRVEACMKLMTSHRNCQWIHNLITGEEKWLLFVNHTHKQQWLEAGQRGVTTLKKMTSTQRRLCWAYGGEWKEWFIGNLFQTAAPSLLTSIVNNWTGLQKNSSESRTEYTFYMTTLDHTLQSRRWKTIEVRMDHGSTSTLFSRLGSYRLPLVPFSV